MFPCQSSVSNEESLLNHQKIEKQLESDKKVYVKAQRDRVKLLLLGTGDAGKSTILKQFRLIHGKEWTQEERMKYRHTILCNLTTAARQLIGNMQKLDIPWGSPQAKEASIKFLDSPQVYGEGEKVIEGVSGALYRIWTDSGIQICYSRGNEFQLMDSCKYFFEESRRICAEGYIPTNQDVLRSRVMTTSITETFFKINGRDYQIVDVGGQRSQRKKWAPYFDDCTAIIYVSAISAYDQTCVEDEKTNRVVESIDVFRSICNHPLFKETSMLIFMNKIDLFKEKLKTVPLEKYFPEYRGANEFDPTSKFISKFFIKCYKSSLSRVYIHYTWATDTNQIKIVLAAVNDIITKINLETSGLT